ncbi:hypothetical protein ACPROK_06785 [Glutamicibacter soli]|uniref:hypothetical protein n=1 Tax=Micrococcaceae TaxID=1268 RepID=UPI00063D89E3|nr:MULTISPECIES: hypothetical protein [Micrococcaceae]ALD65052.1 hypothetical protein AFL94_15210 [Arthrobacter sp. LS16]KLI89068.1 hypothetical protein AA310_15330 [Arthrobacter sp. YC-RL1]RKS18206.1 hypothetical protein DFO58_2563 [Arthrobacter sp. AG1021]
MGNNPKKKQPWSQSIKGPLSFSLILALVAGGVGMITSTGGSQNEIRLDVGLACFGIAFVASLLVISVLTMASKENDPELGKGTGVNRSSANPDKKFKKD